MSALVRGSVRLLALIAFAGLLVGPPLTASTATASTATAGTAAAANGGWSQVTPRDTDIAADIGLARGNDGVLHVLWLAGDSPMQKIMDTQISAKGTASHPRTVASGWFGANVPDATATPHGLFVFWNGLPKGSGTLEPGIYGASRPLKAGQWTVAKKLRSTGLEETEDVADTAGAGPGGHPWVAFTLTDVLGVYPVTDAKIQVIPPSACCVYFPGLADDPVSKTMWVTYFSLITHHEGIFAQKLTGNGRAAGPAELLPGSQTGGNIVEPEQRIGTAARGAGHAGVYVAYGSGYPQLKRVDVVKVGAKTPKVLAKTAGLDEFGPVTLASGASGRLWVAWVLRTSGVPLLFLTESNPAVTSFAKPVKVALPKGTTTVWKLYLNGHGGSVDVLALTSKVASSTAAYWSRVVTPRS